jgi:hypothetical protein
MVNLPSVEEIKIDNHIPRRKRFNVRIVLLVASATLLMISIITVITVLVGSSNSDSGNTNGRQRNFDIQELIDYVTANYDIEFYPSIDSPNSPQYLAAKWLSQEDGLNLKLPSPIDPTSSASDTDTDTVNLYKYQFLARFVMAINYFSLGGPTWKNQLKFLSDEDICSWIGYVSTGSLDQDVDLAGVFCDVETGLPSDLSLCKYYYRFGFLNPRLENHLL